MSAAIGCGYGGGRCGPPVTLKFPVTSVPAHAASVVHGSLPFTGGDVLALAIFGVIVLGTGLALLLLRGGRGSRA